MTYQDQGNQLRGAVGSTTVDNGPLGVTARKVGGTTVYYYSRRS